MSPSTTDTSEGASGIIKIIGVGQILRGDDAAGLAAVQLWQATYLNRIARPFIQVELAELPGIDLLSLIDSARFAIIVDAVHSGAKAGTIHQVSEEQLSSFERAASSAHGWGVAETLSIGRKLMPVKLPDRLILVGIETGTLSLGDGLSEPVTSALPDAARLIERLLTDLETLRSHRP